MYSQQSLEYCFDKFSNIVDKYHKCAYGFYCEWEPYKVYNHKYGKELDILLPNVAIEFIH